MDTSPQIIPPPPPGFNLTAPPQPKTAAPPVPAQFIGPPTAQDESADQAPPPPPGFNLTAPPKAKTKTPPVPPPDTPPESLLHRTGREVIGGLPMIGATAGGILGTGVGPFGTVGGAAVGAGSGEALRQTLIHWFPSMGNAPQEPMDAAMETARQMLVGGATEAASPYINGMLQRAAPWVKASAKKGLLAVMNPTDKYAKGHALEAADQLLERGGWGKDGYVSLTRGQLEQKAADHITDVGAQIGAKEAAIPPGRQVDPALMAELNQSLANYRKSLYMPDDPALPADRLRYGAKPKLDALDVVDQHLANEIPGVNPQGLFSSQISRQSLRALRQSVDDTVRDSEGFARSALVAGGAVEPSLAAKIKVERNAGNIFRRILNQDQPDIAALNSEYHLWSNVRDAMSPASLGENFTKEVNPWQRLWHDRYAAWIAGAGAAAGAANHYGGQAAAEGVGALFAVGALARSAAWRTVSAASKNQLADMLAKGQLEEAAKLATRISIQYSPKVSAAIGDKMAGPKQPIRKITEAWQGTAPQTEKPPVSDAVKAWNQ